MKKTFFILALFTALAFTSCSNEDADVNMQTSVGNIQFKPKSGEWPWYCNGFSIEEVEVSVLILSTPIKIDRPIQVYVCCGPGFGNLINPCSSVSESTYNLFKEPSGTKDAPVVGVPVSEIVGVDPTINPDEVVDVTIPNDVTENGITIQKGKYEVQSDGMIYFNIK